MAEYEIAFICRNCGKQIDIIHPSRWAYKVKNNKGGHWWFCSWKCLREDETKKGQKQAARKKESEQRTWNDRKDVLEKLMAAAEAGQDIYEYLQKAGYTDPKDTLRRLRIKAKKEAPEIYRKMEQMGLLDLRAKNSGKGVGKMSQNKLTREQKEKAVKMALEGGDYLEHLKKCGAKNPSAAWWYIKKTLAKSNPKLLAEVMKKTGEVETIKAPEKTEGPVVKKADKLPPERKVENVTEIYDVEPAFRQEEVGKKSVKVEIAEKLPPEAVAEVPEIVHVGVDMGTPEGDKTVYKKFEGAINKPLNYDGLDVMSVRGYFGTYKIEGIDDKCFVIYYEPMKTYEDKVMPLIINKKNLGDFMKEVKKAAQILGVQV